MRVCIWLWEMFDTSCSSREVVERLEDIDRVDEYTYWNY